MTTVINETPRGDGNGGGGAGWVIGVIIILVIIILFFVYGLPAIRGGSSKTTNIDVNIPTPTQNGGGATGGGTTGGGTNY